MELPERSAFLDTLTDRLTASHAGPGSVVLAAGVARAAGTAPEALAQAGSPRQAAAAAARLGTAR